MSDRLGRFSSSGWSIMVAGAVIGCLGAFLPALGNPPNMGICVACFERDIAGALGGDVIQVGETLENMLESETIRRAEYFKKNFWEFGTR